MIIRKLATALRRQDWVTVLLEVAIVVVGVFIGLQADEWNGQRKDNLRQSALLADLAQGLRSDLRELDSTIALETRRYSSFILLLDKAVGWKDPGHRYNASGEKRNQEHPAVDQEVAADEAITIIQYLRSFDPARQAYDGMVTVGDIFLLHDAELIRDLQAHYLLIEGINDVEMTIYSLTWEQIRARLMDNGVGRTAELDWDEAIAIVQSDTALTGALKAGAFEASDHTQYLQLIKSRTAALLARTEQPQEAR